MNMVVASMTLAQAWAAGGWLMWILLAMSIAGVTLCIYFLITLRQKLICPSRLYRDLPKYLEQDDLSEARRMCEDSHSPLGEIVLAGTDALRRLSNVPEGWVLKVAEEEGTRVAERMSGQVQWLLELATLAPMVGLLGTVIGMLQAFGAVATDVAAAKPTLLAQGVSQAIITTIFGLLIAIPSMGCYAYFRRRLARQLGALERASSELMMILNNKYKVQG